VGVTTLPEGTQGSWGFSLLKGSRHPLQAATVLQWFTGETVSRELAERFGYTPVWTRVLEDPALEARLPLLPVLRRGLEHTALRPLTPVYAQLSDALQRSLSAVITGEESPAEGMEQAQQLSALILKAAGKAP
jgi:multiple sugar transport system substrate-binding protein